MDEEILTEEGEPEDTGDLEDDAVVDEAEVVQPDNPPDNPDIDWDETAEDSEVFPHQEFTSQPVPPYNLGDTWTSGTDVYVCVAAKGVGGLFEQGDWELADQPIPDPTVTTTTSTVSEMITDYSAESLAAYEASGATAWAVYSDGTSRQVQWSEVRQPETPTMTVVSEALEIAQATDQHFWHDTNGAHVTDVEQDEWKQAEQEGTLVPTDEQPFHNLLMNSLGILIRRAKNVLASFSKSAVAFYDGLWDGTGDGSSHVVARFGSDGAQIGRSGEIHLEQGASGVSVVDDAGGELLRFGVNERDGESYAAIISNTLNTLINGTTGSFEISGRLLTLAGADRAIVSGPVTSIRADHQVSVVSDGDVTIAAAPTGTNPQIISLEDGSTTLLTHGGDVVFETNGLIPEQGNGSIRGIGAETLSGHNLSPFFSHDLTDRSYWYNGPSVTALLNASSYKADGWAHVSIPATSANTQYNIRITRAALEGAVPEGEDVTLLVELANVSTTGSVEGKLAQPSSMTGELVQLSGAQDVADGSHWFDGTATGTGGEGLCLQIWQGTKACECDVRVSLFKGKYRGAYKPYVVPECELQDALGLTVESTSTIADIVTASSGFTCTAADFTTYGKVAMGTCTFRADANVAANAVATLGTLADGKRPAKLAGATLGAGTSVYGNAQVTSAGLIQLRPTAQIAANTTFHVRFDYILA